MRRSCVVMLVLFLGLLYGCGDGLSINFSEDSGFITTLSLIDEDDEVVDVVQQGDPVILSFSFQNISGANQTFLFSDAQQYDLEVYDSQDTLVWNWSNGLLFTQALSTLSFEVDETKAFEEVWDQTSNEGDQVPVGIYDVYVNRCWNPDMSAGPVQVEIE
jgi:hypothetical protein